MNNKIYLSCNYSYNEMTCVLYCKNEPVILSKKEKILFELLFHNRGHVVLNDIIENTIWPDYPIKDSTRRTLIYRLRKKISDGIVEHVPRVGCRLVLK